MPLPPFRLSPYKIGIFRQCPRRYRYHYVDALYQRYRRRWPYLTMGDNVHLALRDFFSSANRTRDFSTIKRLLATRWTAKAEGFEDREVERRYWRKALNQLKWFCDTQDLSAQPYLREAIHEAPLSPDLRLLGKVDRVDREADGSFNLIDYKTGKTPDEPDDGPLLTYALLLKKKFGAEVRTVSYLFLNGDGWRTSEPTAIDHVRTEERLFAIRNQIEADKAFVATPNALCPWCDFAELCDVPVGDAWDDSIEEPLF
jgi:putative RecB family exonuclease